MALKKWIKGSRFMIGMLMVQVIATVLQLLSRIIICEKGTFVVALLVYRNIVGAICVAPFAYFLQRGSRNKLNWQVFFWLFIAALTGIEKIEIQTINGKVKIFGTILCLGGALTVALYKGSSFYISHHSFLHSSSGSGFGLKNASKNWTRGTILLVCSCLSYGVWFVSQAKLSKIFPHQFCATFWTCLIAALQQAVVGLCIDRSKAAWHLAWNLQLITIFYSGALATAATFCLIAWTVAERGPTYPSMFNPLALIFVAITEALFLGEPITVGSLIGMGLLVIGLYLFLWAKSQETNPIPQQQ
ncbi:hypothetical protein M9H77_26275 [Catharanthus roseus]|uniref:Uncharacterized protein n=1 Tax=Catharanthus roseus TaxID=4058 RepID=A0ACC0ABY0_CATRO|nr:hypothetical protein M9H77_26275 [Catharanthus roseus]